MHRTTHAYLKKTRIQLLLRIVGVFFFFSISATQIVNKRLYHTNVVLVVAAKLKLQLHLLLFVVAKLKIGMLFGRGRCVAVWIKAERKRRLMNFHYIYIYMAVLFRVHH